MMNFQVESMHEFLWETRPRVEFAKYENVSKILHDEILAFEKAVNNFNQEKKELFDSLLKIMKSNVDEAFHEETVDVEVLFS